MFDITQHSSFVIGVLNLLHLDDLCLLEHFDSVESLVVLRLDQMDSSEATSSERPQYVKVAQRILALCDASNASLVLVVDALLMLLLLLYRLLLILWLLLLLLLLILQLPRLLLRLHCRLWVSLLLLLLHTGRVGSGASTWRMADLST